ncbi:YfiR family protein [Fulvivirgaceae bacterium BMA10]|uniref:YfiR family protein n=1 Tax=Splendidivirga corallicola TaxID=3051826 RepID=A0ABT8KMU9_9BACT|nr:YfiR family protein [Fulvivirgaceae bacterium BMA10]
MNLKMTFKITLCACLVALSGLRNECQAQTDVYKAYSLFIYNFAKYSEWPVNSDQFTIGVLGSSKIVNTLEAVTQNRKIAGKSIVVKQLKITDDLNSSQILFIPQLKSSSLAKVLEQTGNKPVMVVTEKKGLYEEGACISFMVDSSQKLKFEINYSVLSSKNLKMANSLKSLAVNKEGLSKLN